MDNILSSVTLISLSVHKTEREDVDVLVPPLLEQT